MSLKAISSLESASRKLFINPTYIMSRKYESRFLVLRGENEFNSHQLTRIGEKKIFHELNAEHV